MPLVAGDEVRGALTLEREGERPFDWRTVELCEAIAAMAGPMLDVRRRDDRLVWLKLFDSLSQQLAQLFGPHKVALKLGVFAAAAVILSLVASISLAHNGYGLSWWTVGGGGYTFSTGGSYTLGGTIGQPDAGIMSGGGYAIEGGFWGAAAPVEEHHLYLPVVMREV